MTATPYKDDPSFCRPGPLEQAIARSNFRRQFIQLPVECLRILACWYGVPKNDFVN
jgi:hypothetical protein